MTSKMVYLPEDKRKWVYEEYMRRQANRIDKEKQALTFPAQILIFRKWSFHQIWLIKSQNIAIVVLLS